MRVVLVEYSEEEKQQVGIGSHSHYVAEKAIRGLATSIIGGCLPLT